MLLSFSFVAFMVTAVIVNAKTWWEPRYFQTLGGMVIIPGMMTGQILAGSDPIIAIKYQIMVMLCHAFRLHSLGHLDCRSSGSKAVF